MSKSSETGRGKNKRKWTFIEEETILDYVMELKNDPRWKSEGGFKNGFHQHLEEKLENFYPGNGLKASQIESKVKFLKEKYIVIHEMTKLSGFTWDETNCMINCEKQSFDEFCKLHPRAKGLWKTAFPLYNKLELIFGPDRATGNNAEDVEDMVDNMDTEFVDQEPMNDADYYTSSDAATRPPAKRRNIGTSSLGVTRNNDPVACAIEKINGSLAKMSDVMVRSDNRDELQATRQKMLLSELSMLHGVSDDDAIDACRVMTRSPSELESFFSCPTDEWKVRYVERIIAQLRGSTSGRRD